MEKDTSRILGCLAGLAVGDAMGRPTELLFNYRRIERKYGKVEGLVGSAPGRVTDDTRLTLTLADAILANGCMITADEFIGYLKHHPEFSWKKFLRAYTRDEGFWIGEHIAAWAGRLGVPGRMAGYMNPSSLFAGNEGAMMMAPVGIIHRGRPLDACEAGSSVSRVVIAGQGARAAGTWAAVIAEALTEGSTVDSVLDAARTYSSPGLRTYIDRALFVSSEFEDIYSARPRLYRCCLQPVMIDVRETLPIALAVFFISGGDPMDAIRSGANFGRDADTISGMAGLLSGALNGIERIDDGIYEQVRRANEFDLEEYASRLAEVIP